MVKNNIVTKEKVKKYFKITLEALEIAKKAPENLDLNKAREDFLNMVELYLKDAKYFEEKGDLINTFAALNYAHGWLDAGARIGLWEVHDSRLFVLKK